MADSFLQAPADGVGKKLDTRTEGTNSEHRQVVVVGDPATNAGVAPVDATTGLVVNIGPGVDLGSGTGGSKTQRMLVDSSQLGTLGNTTMSTSVPVTIASDQTIAVKAVTTANGETASRVNAANSTNATSLKASAGNVFEIDVYNVAAYAVFLKLYNKASSPTVGTDTPVWTIPIAAGSGFSRVFPLGRNFGTGIAYAITKLQADSDTTVVAAGDLTGSIGWI